MELPNAYWIYFAPFAFLTGIPWQDAVQSGSVMATKLLSNEFVAMQDLGKAVDYRNMLKELPLSS